MHTHYRFSQDPFFKRLFYLAAIVVAGYVVYQLQTVIMPFVVAFILAYLFNPLVRVLQNTLHLRRWLAIVLVYLGVIGATVGLLWWLLPIVWEQLLTIWDFVPKAVTYYNQTIRGWVSSNTPLRLPVFQMKDMSRGVLSYLQNNYNFSDASSLALSVYSSSMSVINIAGLAVLVPILMFYFLYNWDERLLEWQHAIPNRYLGSVYTIATESDEALMSFVKGQLLVMILLGIVYAVQLQMIGLKVGLLIGMVAGLASFVPYLGFALGFVASIAAGIFQFGFDWVHMALIVGAFMVGQMVEGYILQPLLLGDKIGLSPIWVMFAVLAGAGLFGFAGMLVALPVAAVLNVFARHAYMAYRNSEFYQGNRQIPLFEQQTLEQAKREQRIKAADEAAAKKKGGWLNKLNIFSSKDS